MRWKNVRSTVRYPAVPATVVLVPMDGIERHGVLFDVCLCGIGVDSDPCPVGPVSVQIDAPDGRILSRKGVVRLGPPGDRLCHIHFDTTPLSDFEAEQLIAPIPARKNQKEFVSMLGAEDLKSAIAETGHGQSRISQILLGSIAASAAVITFAVAIGTQVFPSEVHKTVALCALLGALPLIVGLGALLVVIRQVNRVAAFATAVGRRVATNSLPETYRGWACLSSSLCDCAGARQCPVTGHAACLDRSVRPSRKNSRKLFFMRPSSIMNNQSVFAPVIVLVGIAIDSAVGSAALLLSKVSLLSLLTPLILSGRVVSMAVSICHIHRGRFSYECYYYAWLHAIACRLLPTLPDAAQA